MSLRRALRSNVNAVSETTKSQVSNSSNSQSSKAPSFKRKRIPAVNEEHTMVVREPGNKASAVNRDGSSTPPPKIAKVPSPTIPQNTSVRVATEIESAKRSRGIGKDDNVPFDRPAEPQRTNAPLKTPRGSRLVTYPSEAAHLSPSRSGIPRPSTTTGNILEEACAHLLRADPRLHQLIVKHHCRTFSAEGLAEEIDPFHSLCSGIMAQQVSGPAAKAIKNRFIGLFRQAPVDVEVHEEGLFPTPRQVAVCEVGFLREAGLSRRKAEYIKGLAEKFASGELSAAMLIEASDDEVLEKLTAVRGLGKWSVEMFACFGLKRMDVFSTGDLGVQRGMASFMGKDVKKLKAKGGGKWKYLSEQEMLDHSAKFSPYRSLFMWYMWRVGDVDLEAVEGSL